MVKLNYAYTYTMVRDVATNKVHFILLLFFKSERSSNHMELETVFKADYYTKINILYSKWKGIIGHSNSILDIVFHGNEKTMGRIYGSMLLCKFPG